MPLVEGIIATAGSARRERVVLGGTLRNPHFFITHRYFLAPDTHRYLGFAGPEGMGLPSGQVGRRATGVRGRKETLHGGLETD